VSKGENIVKWIKGQSISWLGHLERIDEDRMPQKIFTQELEGWRRRGRPRKGWKEEVERDIQVLGMRRWRELVIDREKWKDIVRQAKSPQWAVMPMEEEEEEVIIDGGDTVTQLGEALRCKPEGHGFDSRCCHWNFSLT